MFFQLIMNSGNFAMVGRIPITKALMNPCYDVLIKVQ